jgi:integrase
MRRSELLGLQWSNVDLDRRIAFLAITKNGESRGVPLSSRAVTTLRGLPSSTTGQVFGSLTASALKQSFKRAVRRAGIAGLRFSSVRTRTGASAVVSRFKGDV